MQDQEQKLIELGDSEILLRSPFVREEVQALQEMVPSARWDRLAMVWRIDVRERDQAVQFAELWEYDVTDELKRIQLPRRLVGTKNVKVSADSVIIKFDYDVVLIKEVKRIPNVRWHVDSKTWRAPHSSMVEIVEFADAYNLDIADDVREEAQRIRDARDRVVEASYAQDADIEVPTLELDLYDFQKAGVDYATKKRRTFIADEQGLGKTLQGMATVEYLNEYPCLCVVPPSLLLDWEIKLKEALPHRSVTSVRGRGEFPEHNTDFTIIGWSNIVHHKDSLVTRPYRAAIFDESQAYKNYQAQRTVAAKDIAHSIPQDGVVLLLTGTPITGRPSEYEPQLDMLGKIGEFGGRWGFFKRFCGAYQDRHKRWHLDGRVPDGRLKELNTLLRQTCYIRRLKKDVIADLPDLINDVVYVEMSDKWRREYREAEADIVSYFVELKKQIAEELGESATEAAIRAKIAADSATHLVRIAVLKRITARGKMEAAQEWIDRRVSEGHKIIVGAHHKEITSQLAADNGGLCIVGGQDVEEIELHKEKFQTLSVEEAPVIVLSIQSAKTGHTLHASNKVLELELPWVPTDEDQFFARAHRIGQKDAVQATRMLAHRTIDVDTYHLLKRKRKVVAEAVDGILPDNRSQENLDMAIIDLYLSQA